MSLTTSHCLIRNHWTELLLPQAVIDCVNTLGYCSNANHDLTFTQHDGSPIIDLDSCNDDPYNSIYVPSNSESTGDADNDLSYVSDSDLTAAGVDYNIDNNNANDNNNNNNANDNNSNNDNDDNNNNSNNDDNDDDHNDGEYKHEQAREEDNPEEEEDNPEKQRL